MEIERVLCVKSQVFVFKIPSRSSNKAPRAAEWDLTNPNWEGSLKIVDCDKKLRIDLIDRTGALFGSCPVDTHPGSAVEGVSDSSRYFIIKLVNDNGKHAFIGLGFAERNDSFDFNCAIHDFFTKDARLEAMRNEFKKSPVIDLRLKAGQKLNFDISGLVHRNIGSTPIKPSTHRISTKNAKICTVLLPDEVGDAPRSNSSYANKNILKSDDNLLPDDLFTSEPVLLVNPFDSSNSFGMANTTNEISNPQDDLSNLFAPTPVNSNNQSNNSLNDIFGSNNTPIQPQPSYNMFQNQPSNIPPGMGFMSNNPQSFDANSVFSNNDVNSKPSFVPTQPVQKTTNVLNDPFALFVQNDGDVFSSQKPQNDVDNDIFNFEPTKNNNSNFQNPFV